MYLQQKLIRHAFIDFRILSLYSLFLIGKTTKLFEATRCYWAPSYSLGNENYISNKSTFTATIDMKNQSEIKSDARYSFSTKCDIEKKNYRPKY